MAIQIPNSCTNSRHLPSEIDKKSHRCCTHTRTNTTWNRPGSPGVDNEASGENANDRIPQAPRVEGPSISRVKNKSYGPVAMHRPPIPGHDCMRIRSRTLRSWQFRFRILAPTADLCYLELTRNSHRRRIPTRTSNTWNRPGSTGSDKSRSEREGQDRKTPRLVAASHDVASRRLITCHNHAPHRTIYHFTREIRRHARQTIPQVPRVEGLCLAPGQEKEQWARVQRNGPKKKSYGPVHIAPGHQSLHMTA